MKRPAPLVIPGSMAAMPKRLRVESAAAGFVSRSSQTSFDDLPDEIVSMVLTSVAASATSPHQFISCRIACARLNRLAAEPAVLASLPPSAIACPADRFSLPYRAFLGACAAAGNAEASFLLGTIEFYCLGRRATGTRHLVNAARAGHPAALYSLSVIHFNGSGMAKPAAAAAAEGTGGSAKASSHRNVGVGMLLCVAAAKEGHVDAMRELGLCLQDGYGVKRDVTQGRQLLVEASLRELAQTHPEILSADFGAVSECRAAEPAGLPDAPVTPGREPVCEPACEKSWTGASAAHCDSPAACATGCGSQSSLGLENMTPNSDRLVALLTRRLLAPAGSRRRGPADSAEAQRKAADAERVARAVVAALACSSVAREAPRSHASQFLCDWNALHGLPRSGSGRFACANPRCGRVEVQKGEYRCCAVCHGPRYCSRACQVVDWRASHMDECRAHDEVEGEVEMVA